MPDPGPHRGLYVVMGVSGSGKSLVGAQLARALGIAFLEGDELHPQENVRKMAAGTPLTDADRAGWLRTIADRLRHADEAGTGLVVTCSALKRAYRDLLRTEGSDRTRFVFLRGARDLIARRVASRQGHFMPPSLLGSQFETLEEPAADEAAWVCDVTRRADVIVADLVQRATA